MKPKIWLSSPHMGGNEQRYIESAFEQNWIAPLGPNVTGFEQDLEKYLSGGKNDAASRVAALSSGTAALHLALVLLGVKEGDEVLCQSLTFAASANPIVYQGATPVFVDSESETLNICPSHLEDAIKDRIKRGKKPKALIAVHLYGMPYKVKEVHEVARRFEIPVIEDSAEALGSSYEGQKCGNFGELAILSFNGNKIITTSGGGALVTKDQRVKERAIFLATQARDKAAHYQHSEIGFNYRMSNICAGIGRGQMEVLDKHVEKRRKMHNFYQELFRETKAAHVFSEPDEKFFSNHWLSVVKFEGKDSSMREGLRLHLKKENIESRPLWKPMHLQPVFRKAPFYGSEIAADAFAKALCLPSGSNLDQEQKERISTSINHFLSEKKSTSVIN